MHRVEYLVEGGEQMIHWVLELTEVMKAHTSIFVALGIWVVAYLLLDYGLKLSTFKQKDKRKRINVRLDALKEPYRLKEEVQREENQSLEKTNEFFAKWDNYVHNKEKWNNFKQTFGNMLIRNKMVEALRFEKALPNEDVLIIQSESRKIIKEEKSLAGIAVFNFVLRVFIFVILLRSFHEIPVIDHTQTLVFTTVIVSFLGTLTRKTFLLFFVVAVLAMIGYQYLNGAQLTFILMYWIIKSLIFRVKQVHRWMTKTKNEGVDA